MLCLEPHFQSLTEFTNVKLMNFGIWNSTMNASTVQGIALLTPLTHPIIANQFGDGAFFHFSHTFLGRHRLNTCHSADSIQQISILLPNRATSIYHWCRARSWCCRRHLRHLQNASINLYSFHFHAVYCTWWIDFKMLNEEYDRGVDAFIFYLVVIMLHVCWFWTCLQNNKMVNMTSWTDAGHYNIESLHSSSTPTPAALEINTHCNWIRFSINRSIIGTHWSLKNNWNHQFEWIKSFVCISEELGLRRMSEVADMTVIGHHPQHLDTVAKPQKIQDVTSVLLDIQKQAPAPSTTYFQLILKKPHLILREWPKKRFSQKKGPEPSQKLYNRDEVLSGDCDDRVTWVFGEAVMADIRKKLLANPL